MKKKLTAALLALSLLCVSALADFTDVSSDSWYYEAVSWAEESGIMNGVSENTFEPNGQLTRAMVVTMLYRLDGEPSLPESDWGYPYSDVPSESWFAESVYWARLSGVAEGVSATEFNPNGSITREQLVTMLWRYAGKPAGGGGLSFSDAGTVSSWAYDAAAWAASSGVVSGRDGNIFDPHGKATRAECAAMLMRFAALMPEEPEYVPNLDIIPKNTYDSSLFELNDGRLTYGSGSLCGIDVSSHQGEIDWAAVAADGIDFAIIRAGYRGYSEGEIYLDPCFEANITGALENGLAVGVYFFSQALNVDEALEEARFTLSAIRGYDVTGPVIFDWERIEYDSGRTADASGVTVTDCAIAFNEAVEAVGYQPMCYGSPTTSNADIYLDRLLEYPFWLAHYTKDTAITSFPYHYDMWQYTSSGSVDGIEGRVDLNVAIDSIFGL